VPRRETLAEALVLVKLANRIIAPDTVSALLKALEPVAASDRERDHLALAQFKQTEPQVLPDG
jgi:hypothetical protein